MFGGKECPRAVHRARRPICAALLLSVCMAAAESWPPKVGAVRCLTPGGGVSPSFSRDGKRIAFVRTTEQGVQELWSLPIATGKAERIGSISAVQEPVWSPRCDWIAYLAGPVFARHIYLVDPGVGTPRHVTRKPGFISALSWIDGGERLAYVFGRGKTRRVVAIDPLAEEPVAEALAGLLPGQPAFSPSGRHVAVVTVDERGRLNITVSDRAGKTRTDIPPVEGEANNIRGCYGPAFSPDDRYLVYVRGGIQPLSDLYLRELATGRESRLTTDRCDNQTPVFCPDGKAVAFVAAKGGATYKVWIMYLEGVGALTNGRR